MAVDTGPIATENPFPCRTLVAGLIQSCLDVGSDCMRSGHTVLKPIRYSACGYTPLVVRHGLCLSPGPHSNLLPLLLCRPLTWPRIRSRGCRVGHLRVACSVATVLCTSCSELASIIRRIKPSAMSYADDWHRMGLHNLTAVVKKYVIVAL